MILANIGASAESIVGLDAGSEGYRTRLYTEAIIARSRSTYFRHLDRPLRLERTSVAGLPDPSTPGRFTMVLDS